jgi:hypothetical protein
MKVQVLLKNQMFFFTINVLIIQIFQFLMSLLFETLNKSKRERKQKTV